MRNAARLVPWFAAGVVLAVLLVGITGTAAPQVKPVAVDHWAVTTDDTTSALRTFTTGGANLDAKLAAVIQADRAMIRKRVAAVEPDAPTTPTTPPAPVAAKPTWITFTDLNGFNGVSTINLDRVVCYWRATDADGLPTIMFSGESGLLGTAVETPEMVKFLAEYAGATSFVPKMVGK